MRRRLSLLSMGCALITASSTVPAQTAEASHCCTSAQTCARSTATWAQASATCAEASATCAQPSPTCAQSSAACAQPAAICTQSSTTCARPSVAAVWARAGGPVKFAHEVTLSQADVISVQELVRRLGDPAQRDALLERLRSRELRVDSSEVAVVAEKATHEARRELRAALSA